MLRPHKSIFNSAHAIMAIVLVAVAIIFVVIWAKPITTTNPPLTAYTSKWETFSHKLDDSVTITLKYPSKTVIEEKTLNGQYNLKISPPSNFYLDTKTVEIFINKIPKGQEANYDLTKLTVKEKRDFQGDLISGVLPFKINNISTFEIYSDACLETKEAPVDCKKTSTYFLNTLGYNLKIVTTHYTDANSEPFRSDTVDKIISSISVSSNK